MQNYQTVAQSNLGNLRISASTPTKAKIVKYYNPSDFVMCLIEGEEDEDLFRDVCKFSSTPTSVNVGEIVGVYEENKNKWTRGKVETIIVNKLYEVVTTVEFGVIQVTIDKIRKLPQGLKRIKTEKVYCCLANIVPTSEDRSWSKKDCELFKTITENKWFLVFGVRINARHFVRLVNEQGTDLGTLLPSLINAKMVSQIFRSPAEFWEQNSTFTAYVGDCDSPGHLWVLDDSLDTMTIVTKLLNDWKKLKLVDSKDLDVGSVVAAREISGDKLFHRAIILGDYGKEWLVQYLDFGNKEVVKEIRKLPKELEFYPSMALSLTSTRLKERQKNFKFALNQPLEIHVKLLNIVNVVKIEEFGDSLFLAMPFWNEIGSHENVCVHLENSSPEVELTPYEEYLVKNLTRFDTVKTSTPKPERYINTPSDSSRSSQRLENSSKCEVKMGSRFESLKSYGKLCHSLVNMTCDSNSCERNEQRTPVQHFGQIEDDYARKFKRFEIRHADEKKCDNRAAASGDTDRFDLRERPANYQQKNFVEEQDSGMRCESVISNERMRGSLASPDCRINRSSSNSSKPSPPLQCCEKDKVYIVRTIASSYTTGIVNVRLQSEQSKETLSILGNRLNDACEGMLKSNRKVRPYQRQYLCAKLERNNNWYRCQVIKVIDEKSIQVYCLDFGFYGAVNINHVVLLPGEFSHLPSTTLRIKLADIQPEVFEAAMNILKERKSDVWYMKIVDCEKYPHLVTLSTPDKVPLRELLMENETGSNLKIADSPKISKIAEDASKRPKIKSDELKNVSRSDQLDASSRCEPESLISSDTLKDGFVTLFRSDPEKQECAYNFREMQNDDLPLGETEVVFTAVHGPIRMYCWHGDIKAIRRRLDELSTLMMSEFLKQEITDYVPHLQEVCIAKVEGKCYRAMCSQVGKKCKMLFLDYGLIKFVVPSELRAMQLRYMTPFRFQAILCILHGVKSERTFTDEECNLFQSVLLVGHSYRINAIHRDPELGFYNIEIPCIEGVLRRILFNE